MALNTPSGQPGDSPRPDFQGASNPYRVGYKFMELDPGAQIYVQRDDQLVIQAMSSLVGENIQFGIRTLIPGRDAGRTQPDPSTKDNPLGDSQFGSIIPRIGSFALAGAGGIVTQTFTLSEGFFLSLAISCVSAQVRGTTFVRAFIVRGQGQVANAAYVLCSDYVTKTAPVGFPYGEVRASEIDTGNLKLVQINTPAAGADFAIQPNITARWKVYSIQARLVASAAVANRLFTLRLREQSIPSDAGIYQANAAVTASQTVQLTAAPGILASALIPLDISIVLPTAVTLMVTSTSQISLQGVTTNIQAADQWDNIFAYVEEYLII